MENLRPFSWTRTTMNAQQAGELPIKKGTFAILVTNIGAVGDAAAIVEGYPIHAPLVAGANGESWSVGGIQGTMTAKQTLEIHFAGAATGTVFVQMAFYTDMLY